MSGRSNRVEPVVIVGAGQFALALAYHLERLGIRPLVLDAANRFADSWHRRHPQLRLNTHRRFSRLPGRRLPRAAGTFASRQAIIRYIETYAQALQSRIELGVDVTRVSRDGERWRLETDAGTLIARHVVIATGRERVPVIPRWPGVEAYDGDLRHAANFGDAGDYRDLDVLVVGCGNSAVDMLNHLVRVPTRSLRVAVRNRPCIIPARLHGIAVQALSGVLSRLPLAWVDRLLARSEAIAFGNLEDLGFPPRGIGAATRLDREGVAPAIDDGFVEALQRGRAGIVPAVSRFEDGQVILEDGQTLRPDVLLCATGYSPGLEDLVGHLGVLDGNGLPRFHGGEAHPRFAGLWFAGMKPRLYGGFHAARREGRELARRIVSRLRSGYSGRMPVLSRPGRGSGRCPPRRSPRRSMRPHSGADG